MKASSKTPADDATGGTGGSSAHGAIGSISRRSFLASGVALGAGASLGPLGRTVAAYAEEGGVGRLSSGDAAILRFLAAAEILETDLWQQYNELGGIQDSELPKGGGSQPYIEALEKLDEDMPQYIHDNTEDELSHFTFINAYLESRDAEPVSLDHFRTLPSSKATGARQVKRLTNLMELTVDTSYWTRYRSRTQNPDLGDSFAPAVPGLLKGKFPAIPRSDEDLAPEKHLQAIANTAGFHFAFIEQGGTSLYPSLAQRVSDPQVLRVLLSIGPTETMHFQTWSDKAGNAPPLTDPTNGLVFPNLNEAQPGLVLEDTKTNLIMPEPTAFLSRKFPVCSIIRPTNTEGVAMGAVKALSDDGLFRGQTPEFFSVLNELAAAADAARPRR
jgi:ferritin-like protein